MAIEGASPMSRKCSRAVPAGIDPVRASTQEVWCADADAVGFQNSATA